MDSPICSTNNIIAVPHKLNSDSKISMKERNENYLSQIDKLTKDKVFKSINLFLRKHLQ